MQRSQYWHSRSYASFKAVYGTSFEFRVFHYDVLAYEPMHGMCVDFLEGKLSLGSPHVFSTYHCRLSHTLEFMQRPSHVC